MILCTFEDDRPMGVEQAAARMVEISMASKSSVCAIVGGIPLVTYPNDCRPLQERIENLVLAHADGWVRSRMKAEPLAKPDTRFDPKFKCDICMISASREEVLREALAALADVARKKLPDDGEIAAMASAADTILQTTKDQRNMVRQFEELLKP
jgi:hypothetical protein